MLCRLCARVHLDAPPSLLIKVFDSARTTRDVCALIARSAVRVVSESCGSRPTTNVYLFHEWIFIPGPALTRELLDAGEDYPRPHGALPLRSTFVGYFAIPPFYRRDACRTAQKREGKGVREGEVGTGRMKLASRYCCCWLCHDCVARTE